MFCTRATLLIALLFAIVAFTAQSANTQEKVPVAKLVERLSADDQTVREQAAVFVRKMDEKVIQEVISLLDKRLSDPKADIRSKAARALGELGSKAKPAVPSLQKLFFSEEDQPVIQSVARALKSIEDTGLEQPPFEQKGKFRAVSGEEGVANFPFPYALPPNVELTDLLTGTVPAPVVIVKEVTATGFKWKSVGEKGALYGDVRWRAKGVKATKIAVEERK